MRRGEEFENFVAERTATAYLTNTANVMGMRYLPGEAEDPERAELSVLAQMHAINEEVQFLLGKSFDNPEMPEALRQAYAALSPEEKLTVQQVQRAEIKDYVRKPKVENTEIMSMLDIVTLGVETPDEVKRFLRVHGIDIDSPENKYYLAKVVAEAIDYYHNNLKDGGQIHRDFLPQDNADEMDHINNIFLTASGYGRHQLNQQACALLRIAAVIDYTNTDPRLRLLDDVAAELEKFEKNHILPWSQSKNSMVFSTLGEDAIEIPIFGFSKRLKERHRIITKLLNKPKTSASDLSDPYGMMFIPKTAVGALQLVYYLFASRRAALPLLNVRPHRSRRRIRNIDAIIQAMKNVFDLPFSQQEAAATKVVSQIAELREQQINIDREEDSQNIGTGHSHNNSSSASFQTLSITYDHRVTNEIGEINLVPVEIQIVPEAAYLKNMLEAPHHEYEATQTERVFKRVYRENNLMSEFNKAIKNNRITQSNRGFRSTPNPKNRNGRGASKRVR